MNKINYSIQILDGLFRSTRILRTQVIRSTCDRSCFTSQVSKLASLAGVWRTLFNTVKHSIPLERPCVSKNMDLQGLRQTRHVVSGFVGPATSSSKGKANMSARQLTDAHLFIVSAMDYDSHNRGVPVRGSRNTIQAMGGGSSCCTRRATFTMAQHCFMAQGSRTVACAR